MLWAGWLGSKIRSHFERDDAGIPIGEGAGTHEYTMFGEPKSGEGQVIEGQYFEVSPYASDGTAAYDNGLPGDIMCHGCGYQAENEGGNPQIGGECGLGCGGAYNYKPGRGPNG